MQVNSVPWERGMRACGQLRACILREHSITRLGMAVPHVRHIVGAVQVLVAVGIVQEAALPAHDVQRPVVVQRRVGADDRAPLGQHLVVGQVAHLLRVQGRWQVSVPAARNMLPTRMQSRCMQGLMRHRAAVMEPLHVLSVLTPSTRVQEPVSTGMRGVERAHAEQEPGAHLYLGLGAATVRCIAVGGRL